MDTWIMFDTKRRTRIRKGDKMCVLSEGHVYFQRGEQDIILRHKNGTELCFPIFPRDTNPMIIRHVAYLVARVLGLQLSNKVETRLTGTTVFIFE